MAARDWVPLLWHALRTCPSRYSCSCATCSYQPAGCHHAFAKQQQQAAIEAGTNLQQFAKQQQLLLDIIREIANIATRSLAGAWGNGAMTLAAIGVIAVVVSIL